ncbi:uncharacterized protein IUM83_07764 [Phytophthora cinnamomi]|uniref:uncharacterized protein n=1 Tax=Phytophthora cinnamomi TaxID=4785 RepID=UPI00355A89DF|nr:hypothetical protein IUM83_07764 [Phytophthora cinnamomi]
MEKRIMATFQRFVRLWRERKRRSEQAALNLVHGNGSAQPNSTSGNSNGAGRNGSKLRREVEAQSSNVASILSRRMIGEVPALKFFDEDEAIPADQNVPDPILIAAAAARGPHKKSEEITVERATSKTLRRKMIRRVKLKHQAIGRLSDDFKRSRSALTAKLGSQLALRQAEGERMFSKRLSLLLSNNVELPPHMAAKELALARLRFKKVNLQARCQTLAMLGAALHHVETAGEVSGLEISSGEQQFLELLRCAVEGDHALTPLLINSILGQFNSEQRHKPLVAGLLGLLDRAASAETCSSHHSFAI